VINKLNPHSAPSAGRRRARGAAALLAAILMAAPSAWAQLPDLGLDDTTAPDEAKAKKFLGDPIVFVHGCPVPSHLGKSVDGQGIATTIGSGSNYRTALLWQKMYAYFRDHGYPAPEWSDKDADEDGYPDTGIPTSSSDHPSSMPASDNYLNILVLSEGKPGSSGTCGSNLKHATEIDEYVQRVLAATGAPKVDIVANSVGGLAARWYMKPSDPKKPSDPNLDAEVFPVFPTFDGARYVRDVALLAVPNHGTELALATEAGVDAFTSPNYDGAREAAPAYNCDPVADPFQAHLNGCEGVDTLVETVTGEDLTSEQEEKVSYKNFYNDQIDELNHPTQSACLNQRFPNDCADPVNVPIQHNERGAWHGNYRLNDEVIEATFRHVTSRKPKHNAK
jgi:hypothetical protein